MPLATNPRYRIFISYCHHDLESVKKIVSVLEQNGMIPLWDQKFGEGDEFRHNIRMYIQHAQVVIPVISKASSEGGWVHQEIGYAMAFNIPILPIVIGKRNPGQMLEDLHAFKWRSPRKPKQLKDRLTPSKMRNLIKRNSDKKALYECAPLQQERTVMIGEYATTIMNLFPNHEAMIRQIGGLSSFHLPDKYPGHKDWSNRIGGKLPDQKHCETLWEERRLIGDLGKHWGFRIMINPWYPYEQHGENATLTRITRLTNLLEFLENLPKGFPGKYGVVLDKEIDAHANTLIVGDLFMASSKAGRKGQGYLQTIFTRHSKTTEDRIQRFDSEFFHGLGSTSIEESLKDSIRIIKGILKELKADWKNRKKK